MPIEGVSDIVRIPRLGKIHLGFKAKSEAKNVEYPKATDYFVCPDEVTKVYGARPKELAIMFPTEDEELFAQQWLRAYSLTQGLVCIGTGVQGRRKMDVATGAMADHETKDWEWRPITCEPQECPEYQGKRCRRVMNLQFVLPDVPGLGVYQIDTSSFYSIVNINSMIKVLKSMLGRCSMVPLTLALGPIEVYPPGGTKKIVHVMHIKKDIKLSELAKLAQLPPGRVLIPEADTEEAPDDLFPDSVIGNQGHTSKPPSDRSKPPFDTGESSSEQGKSPEDSELFEDIRTIDSELLKGWRIVKETVHELRLTDEQVKIWFGKSAPDLEIGLEDFNKALPPEKLTNDLLSRFQTMLDAYRDRKKEEENRKP